MIYHKLTFWVCILITVALLAYASLTAHDRELNPSKYDTNPTWEDIR